MNRRGFTLIELLVVISIIGTLATAGVVSYSSVRATARDAKRLSDARQLQAAVEIYYENHDEYPSDGIPGAPGLLVGETPGWSLTDDGFAATKKGQIYMLKLPKNAQPYGAPYVYRSLDAQGKDCLVACADFSLLFYLEKGAADYGAGAHSISAAGIADAPGVYERLGIAVSLPEVGGLEKDLDGYVSQAATAATAFVNDERTQAVAEKAVAPAASLLAIINTTAASGSQIYHFFLFLASPLQLLRRRRYRAWGTVYNSLTHLPEDLAIVRLFDERNKLLRSQVTDQQGRFSFMVSPGRYHMTVAKVGYAFPSAVARGKTEDGPFQDVYVSGGLDVTHERVLTPNIPIDPPEASAADAAAVKGRRRKERRHSAAVMSLGLGVIAFAVRPTVFTGLLFVLQVVLYSLFKRLAEPPEPKTWGIVYDQESEKPVPQAIVRIFESRYNKLLESQVTDRLGRYHFRVGSNTYYLTVTRPGYFKTETAPLDLTAATEATVIASDLPLKRNSGEDLAPVAGGKKASGGLLVGRAATSDGRLVGAKSTATDGEMTLENILGTALPDKLKPSVAVPDAAAAPAVAAAEPSGPATPIIAIAQAMGAKVAAEKAEGMKTAPAVESAPAPEPTPAPAPEPVPEPKKAWFRDV